MNLKVLNKTELDRRIKSLATRERELLHEILLTIKEIDRRRTYLELGFSNLFSYLVEGIGYSAGSAQRRIDAARLLGEVPNLGEKLQTGELKLQQISLVQKAAREVQKTRHQKVRPEAKLEVLEQLSHKNHADSEKIVAAFFALPVLQTSKKHTQADESVRVELTISKELYAKIQEAQALLSHSLPTEDLVKYLEYVTERVIRAKKEVRSGTTPTTATVAATGPVPATVAGTVFSQSIKKQILRRQKCCQYVDPISQKQCGSRWFLQIDHKHSRWAGGLSTAANAQVLCGRHNRQKYQREAGTRYL